MNIVTKAAATAMATDNVSCAMAEANVVGEGIFQWDEVGRVAKRKQLKSPALTNRHLALISQQLIRCMQGVAQSGGCWGTEGWQAQEGHQDPQEPTHPVPKNGRYCLTCIRVSSQPKIDPTVR